MSHRRRIGLSITNSSLIFDKQPSTWSHSTLLEPIKDCTRWKMKKTMQKLENLTTIRRRWSQLEVKLVTEKLKNEGTGSIRLKPSIASIIFSLISSIAAFSAFHRSKKKKTSFDEWRKTFSLETFFTRPHICNWSSYRILSPPPAPVHRTTFLGQQNFIIKSVINRHPTWTLCFEKSNSTFSFEATNAKPNWERRRRSDKA
jgi:hypothetical protein